MSKGPVSIMAELNLLQEDPDYLQKKTQREQEKKKNLSDLLHKDGPLKVSDYMKHF